MATTSPLVTIILLLLITYCAHAQQVLSRDLDIYDEDSDKYSYHGCYNETTAVEDSAGTRALDGGITETREDEMTVPMCLDICSKDGNDYRYAGLQWGRECWCADTLAGIAEELDDAECNFTCEGDDSTACGGQLKLSVYKKDSSATSAQATSWRLPMLISSLGVFWMYLP